MARSRKLYYIKGNFSNEKGEKWCQFDYVENPDIHNFNNANSVEVLESYTLSDCVNKEGGLFITNNYTTPIPENSTFYKKDK